MKILKEYSGILTIAALVAFIGYDRFAPKQVGPDPAPVVVVDKVAIDLGKAYKSALISAADNAIETASNATATSTAQLAGIQRDKFKSALETAYRPVADEMDKRQDGVANSETNPSAVAADQAFFKSFLKGYRGK